MRNKGLVLLLAVLTISACGYKHRPVYNVDDPMPHWTQNLPPQRVEDLITASCLTLGWKVQHVADGHLTATQAREKFSATVDIFYDQQHWQIHYNSSVGLLYEGDTIHDHYNVWIHNLEREIQMRFNSTLPPAGQ